jgi:transposase-like protein
MAAGPSIGLSGWLEEQLAQTSPDLLRAMVTTFAEALMGAEADAVCGAPSLHVTSAEDGAGWLGFFRDLTAAG